MTDLDSVHDLEKNIIMRVRQALAESETAEALRFALHFNAVQIKYAMHELPPHQQDSVKQHLSSQKELKKPPSSLDSEEERQAYLQLLTFVLGRTALL